MSYKHIEVKPPRDPGAEIHGVEASIDDEIFAEVHSALDHLVIFFRDQDITPDQQVAFSARLHQRILPVSERAA